MGRLYSWMLILGMLVALGSCKVNYSFTGADIPIEAETVSIRTFQTESAQADPLFAQQFTESFKDVILQQSRLQVVQREGDLQFDGSIVGYETAPGAITGNETAALNRFTVTVRVRYVNPYDRDRSFERSFSQFVDYNATQDFRAVEAQLLTEITPLLTQAIFDAAFSNW